MAAFICSELIPGLPPPDAAKSIEPDAGIAEGIAIPAVFRKVLLSRCLAIALVCSGDLYQDLIMCIILSYYDVELNLIRDCE